MNFSAVWMALLGLAASFFPQEDMMEGKDPCLAQAYRLASEVRKAAQTTSTAGKN